MRVNSEEAIRRGREARAKAGSWMELRKTAAVGRFSSRKDDVGRSEQAAAPKQGNR